MVSINGKALPKPTKYEVTMSDLDSSDSTRNEEGVLTRNRIRQGVTKVSLGYTVRGADVAAMMALIEPAQVTATILDPRVSATRNIKAYVSDRSCNVKVYLPDMTPEEVLWEVNFNLIEY